TSTSSSPRTVKPILNLATFSSSTGISTSIPGRGIRAPRAGPKEHRCTPVHHQATACCWAENTKSDGTKGEKANECRKEIDHRRPRPRDRRDGYRADRQRLQRAVCPQRGRHSDSDLVTQDRGRENR